jgi:Zn-dependent protease/CBS domain-containing protein
MKYSFKIASAWGIPIELHVTFLLLIVFAALGVYYLGLQLYIFYAILLLFVFVILHELSHSLVARHYNIKVRRIVLYPIGGVSEIDEIPENPHVELRMAAAGPLASLAIGGLLLLFSMFVIWQIPETLLITTTVNMVSYLGQLNILLGAFNLLPAFPMDGGRVFRALLAERLKFVDATRYAAFIGRLFGIFMAVFGILYNFWFVIIGVFVYFGASEEAEAAAVSYTLHKVKISDIMHPEVASTTPETTLTEALEIMFKARYHDALVEKDGVLLGIVTWDELRKIKPEVRDKSMVGKLPIKKVSIFSDEPAVDAYKIMAKEKIDLVPVVHRDNTSKVVGVVTSESIAYAYEKAKSMR